MTQTLAIFYGAYRNLNSRKLFWISLVISALVVAAFAMVGITDRGLKIITWEIESHVLNTRVMEPDVFYKMIFVQVGVGVWLAWIATILALVSTAGIFPDLITSGSVDLYVSKPMSRARLFLTEYLAGLLFVTLQVAVFSLASFLVIGSRGGAWEPGVFVSIPLVVSLFSYLFAVCVLLGVITRSTVASLLMTLLFWFGVAMIGAGEQGVLVQIKYEEHKVDLSQMFVVSGDGVTAHQTGDDPKPKIEEAKNDSRGEASRGLKQAHRILYGIKTVLPKTGDTVELLRRSLISLAELPDQSRIPDQRFRDAQRDFQEEIENRSVAWVVGTSLAFECVVLALAAAVFCRRDFS